MGTAPRGSGGRVVLGDRDGLGGRIGAISVVSSTTAGKTSVAESPKSSA
jgi:hypothetical protein